MEKPCRVFCCYAREDQEYLQKLKNHLYSLQRQNAITVQADIDISPGKEWKREIDHHLGKADIILLLISSDFIASDYCFDTEMRQAIARHKQGTARVVPVIIRPTDWQRTPFGGLECLPKNGKPVSTWENIDNAFLSITQGIRVVVQELTTNISDDQEKEYPSMPPTKEDPSSASGQEKDNTSTSKFSFAAPVQATVIGDNTRIDTINNIYKDRKDGIRSLEKGSKALWNRKYPSANEELRVAVEEIDGEGKPGEAAKARYFFALALLNGKLPRTQGNAVMQSVVALMSEAITLSPCASYYRIFACIEKDLSSYTRDRNLLNEVFILESKGASLPRCADDEENEAYFQRCQPLLQL